MRWAKHCFGWGLCVVMLSLITACSSASRVEKPIISVSLLPEKYFVERIVGELAEVHVVVPRGSNPETYDPSPRDIAMLQNSLAYLAIGTLPFEAQWVAVLPKEVAYFDLTKQLPRELIEGGHEGHQHALGDPHYWTSLSGGEAMAEAILAAMLELFPEHREEIEANYQANVVPELEAIRQLGRGISKGDKDLAFVIYHPSLSLFAREWGLTQLPIEEDGEEPTPRHLVELIERARSMDTRAVLVQAEFGTKNATAVAKELGLKVVSIDPLAEDWGAEMRRLIEIFR